MYEVILSDRAAIYYEMSISNKLRLPFLNKSLKFS